jgi:hypothetical protein
MSENDTVGDVGGETPPEITHTPYAERVTSADPVAAALMEELIDTIEDFSSRNTIAWFSAIGVVAALQRYVNDLMLEQGVGRE